MKEKLLKLLENAYAPYSKFKVAAIVETNEGIFYEGVNIENASYGATICAERVAIFDAVKSGCKLGDFKNIHLMCSDDIEVLPCFLCRQVMSEFFTGDESLYVYTKDRIKVYRVKELMPFPFVLEDNHA